MGSEKQGLLLRSYFGRESLARSDFRYEWDFLKSFCLTSELRSKDCVFRRLLEDTITNITATLTLKGAEYSSTVDGVFPKTLLWILGGRLEARRTSRSIDRAVKLGASSPSPRIGGAALWTTRAGGGVEKAKGEVLPRGGRSFPLAHFPHTPQFHGRN